MESVYRNFRNISKTELNELGIKEENMGFVETIDDLKKTLPNIIIGECVQTVKFRQNNYKNQELIKRGKYVMGLGIYNQLYYDTRISKRILKPASIQFKNLYKPYFGQNLDNKTLLVWRTGGLGDLCFIQPNLVYLKSKYPTCKIIFATGSQYHSMIKTWDCIDEVINLPFSMRYVINSDYHAIFEGVIERTKQAEKENSYRLFTKWLGLNLEDKLLIPHQKVLETSINKCKEILNKWGLKEKEFIIIQMRASSPIRTPNPNVFLKLINELTKRNYKIILTDMPSKTKEVSDFINKVNEKNNVFNFAEYSKEISDTVSLVSLAKLCIGVDSSLNHIGVSVNTKVFGIFGPFNAEIRLDTYPSELCDWINCGSETDCCPCFTHSMTPCKNSIDGYPKCFDQLNINLCIEKIERLIG